MLINQHIKTLEENIRGGRGGMATQQTINYLEMMKQLQSMGQKNVFIIDPKKEMNLKSK
ncbi:hypothetical protein [Bacillus paralicheniformis]|uniref:hypothetical protein n=1 Tax=Bacillus paralicheniformis TaxID=1648923 RepID=UPI001FD6AC75|nr:hypothetical protein [Bacillus paralicheniformis]MCJ8223671.1 hypothetical protein [Bacillus paralicheniformis]